MDGGQLVLQVQYLLMMCFTNFACYVVKFHWKMHVIFSFSFNHIGCFVFIAFNGLLPFSFYTLGKIH